MIHWEELRRDDQRRWGVVYPFWPDKTHAINVERSKSWTSEEWHAATVNWSAYGLQSPGVAVIYGRALILASRQARKYDEEQTP